MISVAAVRSATGSANYFAADNYYTLEEAEGVAEWFGEGAELLGLCASEDELGDQIDQSPDAEIDKPELEPGAATEGAAENVDKEGNVERADDGPPNDATAAS